MQILRIINQITAFLLEIYMFIALGFIGYQLGKSVLIKYTLVIGLPLMAIVLWGLFAAPKSNFRLGLPWRIIFEIILFSITSFLLYKTGFKTLAFSLWIIILINELTAYLFER